MAEHLQNIKTVLEVRYKQRILQNNKSGHPLFGHRPESAFELGRISHLDGLQLDAQRHACSRHLFPLGLESGIGRIAEDGDSGKREPGLFE